MVESIVHYVGHQWSVRLSLKVLSKFLIPSIGVPYQIPMNDDLTGLTASVTLLVHV